MANEFFTIRTFIYASEVALPKAFLDAEGVFSFVKDELLVQTQPFYSNAIGGIKLQVRADDYQKANEILIFHGYPEEKPAKNAYIYDLLVHSTAAIPLLGKMRFEIRFTILLSILVIGLYFLLTIFQ
jgi:hypothetical protein